MMSILVNFESVIRQKVEKERWTHKQISHYLQGNYPGVKGLSVRSIERFCCSKNIHKTVRMLERELDEIVYKAIRKVGPTYGRKTMTGLLASQGIRVGQGSVGKSLKRVCPRYHHSRVTSSARLLNPIPYSAEYFGHKVHVDQNEKLNMYGITHVCARDGFSGKVVGFITMPIKNNIEIYQHLFRLDDLSITHLTCDIITTVYVCSINREIILEYGLWDQVRVDHGKEFFLMLHVQEGLAHLRTNTSRAPHLQSTSRQNHPVERIWVEVNSRVNYPIKACLIMMEENGVINMESALHKFCVSWFTIRVCCVGTKLVVEAWNDHPISGPTHARPHGSTTPNQLMLRFNRTAKIAACVVPSVEEAVQNYTIAGGHLTESSLFGEDPLDSDTILQREVIFFRKYPSFDPFFHNIVNGNSALFQDGLKFFIHLTETMSQ